MSGGAWALFSSLVFVLLSGVYVLEGKSELFLQAMAVSVLFSIRARLEDRS